MEFYKPLITDSDPQEPLSHIARVSADVGFHAIHILELNSLAPQNAETPEAQLEGAVALDEQINASVVSPMGLAVDEIFRS